MSADTLRILIVDDSALYRQLVRNVLRKIAGTMVVGIAKNGAEALSLVEELQPDLLTLDVQMPDVDGLEVLRSLRKNKSSAKAIMLSSLTANGAQTTTDALLEGAFDFIHKPSGPDASRNRQALQCELGEKLAAFRSGWAGGSGRDASTGEESELVVPRASPRPRAVQRSIVIPGAPRSERDAVLVIGTSTGGPVALGQLLPELPGDFPIPILIVQHMPPGYTHSLAERLNQRSALEVVEGADGMVVERGFAYIAPGGQHLKVASEANRVLLRTANDPPENCCRPSIDYLFRSAAEVYDGQVLALILTGMGRDGTEGCREIKHRGGFVMAQHPDGCTVYGMPKAVAEEQLADLILPLDRLAAALSRRVRRGRTASNG